MSITSSDYTTLKEIKYANNAAGKYWWSKDTKRMFKPKMESGIFIEPPTEDYPRGSRCWVESTCDHTDTGREYKLVRFDVATGDVSYIRQPDSYDRYCYPTKAPAIKALRDMLTYQKAATA